MSKIKENLITLKEMDIWTLLLFALYKIKDLPEYSTLSELAYILDKKSLLKLCEYFGGITMTIPTIEDLENLTKSLLLYQYTIIEHKTYDEAIELLGDTDNLRLIKSNYVKLCNILDKYTFSER